MLFFLFFFLRCGQTRLQQLNVSVCYAVGALAVWGAVTDHKVGLLAVKVRYHLRALSVLRGGKGGDRSCTSSRSCRHGRCS